MDLSDLSGITVLGFALSLGSLYASGVFLDALLVSGLDDFDRRISAHWRRLATGLSMFFLSFAIVLVDQSWERFEGFSQFVQENMSRLDLILLLSVTITWVLSTALSVFALFVDRLVQEGRTSRRLTQIAGRNLLQKGIFYEEEEEDYDQTNFNS